MRPAEGTVCPQPPGTVVVRLRREESQLKIDDVLELAVGRGLRRLRMDGDGIESLMREVGGQVGKEGLSAAQRRDGLAAVEHDRAQKTEIGRWQRSTIDRYDGRSTARIRHHGAAVRVVDDGDGELRVGRWRHENANEAVLEEQAVVGRITQAAVRTVRPVHGGE